MPLSLLPQPPQKKDLHVIAAYPITSIKSYPWRIKNDMLHHGKSDLKAAEYLGNDTGDGYENVYFANIFIF